MVETPDGEQVLLSGVRGPRRRQGTHRGRRLHCASPQPVQDQPHAHHLQRHLHPRRIRSRTLPDRCQRSGGEREVSRRPVSRWRVRHLAAGPSGDQRDRVARPAESRLAAVRMGTQPGCSGGERQSLRRQQRVSRPSVNGCVAVARAAREVERADVWTPSSCRRLGRRPSSSRSSIWPHAWVCMLVVLCSKQTRVEQVAKRVANTPGAKCLIIPILEGWTHADIPVSNSRPRLRRMPRLAARAT